MSQPSPLVQTEFERRRSRSAKEGQTIPTPNSASKVTQPDAAERFTGSLQDTVKLNAAQPVGPETALPLIEGYEVESVLGRGTMGVVYKARQLALNRLVAVKMIRAGAHAGSEELNRFMEEAQVVARLQHPQIVQIYEINLHGGFPYFTMEYVEGGTLADRLVGRPQPFRQAAHLIELLAHAIHVAHQHGIVHRDLKPANILLQRTSESSTIQEIGSSMSANGTLMPKITDFGLAKRLGQDANLTQSGMVMGTPNYMAPEQAEGKSKEVGPAADIYGLGAILYELLTGRPPYVAESPMETVLMLFHAEPMPPSKLQPKIPRDLETICLKCLQKDPRRRYRSAEELAEDLRRFLAGESIAARPITYGERAWKWTRRRPALATLLASAVLTLCGLVALTLWHQFDLHDKLGQAREDERQARSAQEASQAREHLNHLRVQVNSLLQTGETALARQDLREARLELTRARDKAGNEPELADTRARIDRLLALVNEQWRDREAFQRFLRLRNEALFHASLLQGGQEAASLEQTQAAARQALSLFGANPGSETMRSLDGSVFQETDKAVIVSGCYELLLILAETVARSPPNSADVPPQAAATEALHIVDHAGRLGLTTKAWHSRRALYLERLGDFQSARQERNRADALDPSTALDCFLLGQERFLQERWTEANVALETALRLQPDHFWARYYLSLCCLRTNQVKLAVAGLTTCVSQRPDFPWLFILRASSYAELGEFDQADADFRHAQTQSLDPAAQYTLLMNRGVMRIRQDRIREGIADLQQATSLKPNLYQSYLNLAHAMAKEKNWDEALRYVNEAIQRERRLGTLYRFRAMIKEQKNQLAEALVDLDRAIELDERVAAPSLTFDYLDQGRILHQARNHSAALAAYEKALSLRPESLVIHRLRADALMELGEWAKALESLDVCVRSGKADARTYKLRAQARAQMGRFVDAQADYTSALELTPDAATYAARGWSYVVVDAYKAALADFEKAIRLDPAAADYYAGRGYCRAKLGNIRDAVQDADEARKKGPSSSRIAYQLARIYAQVLVGLEKDKGLTGNGRWELQAQYKERAVQLLQQTLTQMPSEQRPAFWRNTILSDVALHPLRRLSAFHQLAAFAGGS